MPVVAAMTVTSHATDAMVAIPFWLEMFAVVAASISGVLVAREHKLDLVGAVALAVVCGLGGGLLRDMTLQVGNVYILNQPMALPLSIATAAIIYIFPAIVDKPEKLIPLLDIISVGIYAATGADKALVYGFAPAQYRSPSALDVSESASVASTFPAVSVPANDAVGSAVSASAMSANAISRQRRILCDGAVTV